MKRIYVIIFAATLSAFIFSCENKTASETMKDKIDNTGDDIKNTSQDVKEDIKEESQKTTKNGSDAH